MAKGPRLKVFAARMGFFDTVVAVPSQAAALRAWGVHQNLFQQGLAAPTDDPAATEAALARPGAVLRRPVGSTDPYSPDAEARLEIPDPPRPKPVGKRKAAPPPPPPDRSALEAAERALFDFDQEEAQALAEIGHARLELDERERELRRTLKQRRKGLDAARAEAERAYRRAGGR